MVGLFCYQENLPKTLENYTAIKRLVPCRNCYRLHLLFCANYVRRLSSAFSLLLALSKPVTPKATPMVRIVKKRWGFCCLVEVGVSKPRPARLYLNVYAVFNPNSFTSLRIFIPSFTFKESTKIISNHLL